MRRPLPRIDLEQARTELCRLFAQVEDLRDASGEPVAGDAKRRAVVQAFAAWVDRQINPRLAERLEQRFGPIGGVIGRVLDGLIEANDDRVVLLAAALIEGWVQSEFDVWKARQRAPKRGRGAKKADLAAYATPTDDTSDAA